MNQFRPVSKPAVQPNRLRGAACYLAGPMTACTDFGASWRRRITPKLREMGVVLFDPTNKPIEIGQEGAEVRRDLNEMRAEGDIAGVREFLKVIRRVDLRAVDLSSFTIVYLDGTPTMGTYEEIAMAVREQKPLLVWLDGDLNLSNVNPWLLAQVPLHHIFESEDALMAYLHEVDSSPQHPEDRRWMLFDFVGMYQPMVCGGFTLSEQEKDVVLNALNYMRDKSAAMKNPHIALELAQRLSTT